MAVHTILFMSLLFSMVPLFRAACQDDDITLSFTASSYRVNENNGPAQPVLVLSHAIDCCSTISVWVNIEEDTAKVDEDFICGKDSISPVQVLFPGGQTRVSFDVRMVDNVMLEDSEKFIVSIDPLSLPYGVSLGDDPTAEVIIMDDDVATVSFESTTYEVEEGDGHVELTLELTKAVPFNTSLELQTIDDTTTRRCDYNNGSYDVTIPVGVTTFNYSLPILDDDVYEINENFSVVIASSNHPQININQTDNTADVTIIDDEEPISVSFSKTTFHINERDGVVAPVLTLSKPSPCCLHLYVEVEDVNATRGYDYGDNDTTQYIVTFPAGRNCSSFDIPIINDTEVEGNESFRITIMEMSLPFGIKLGDIITADVVIEDNDNYLNFSNVTYTMWEDGGRLCFNLTLAKPALFDTTVTVEVIEGGDDDVAGPYYINFTEGDMSAKFCINITNDNTLEDDKTYMLRINTIALSPEIIPVHPVEAMATILDDEYTFYFDQPTYIITEGDENVTIAMVNLTFSIELRRDTMVQFRYDDLTAIGNESNRTGSEVADYNVSYSWPNFDVAPKGSTVYTLNIAIIPDKILEDNELFRIYVDEPQLPNGMIPIQVDIIIMNDDDFVIGFDRDNLSYAVNTKNEPDVPMIKFHSVPDDYDRDMFFPVNIIIREGAEGDTAIGGYSESEGDYVYQNYSYTFNSTDDQYPVIIRPVDDNIVEPDEYFSLTFSLVGEPDHFTTVNKRVTITIFNDDVCTVWITEQNGRDTLYFSKELSTNVTVIITYNNGTRNQTIREEFTAEETNTRNYYPLPDNVIEVDVFVREDFLSRLPNLVSGDPELIKIKTLEPPV